MALAKILRWFDGVLDLAPRLRLRLLKRLKVSRDGHGSVRFTSTNAWILFEILYEAGETGVSRKELMNEIWEGRKVAENNLDQTKIAANETLAPLQNHGRSPRGYWEARRHRADLRAFLKIPKSHRLSDLLRSQTWAKSP